MANLPVKVDQTPDDPTANGRLCGAKTRHRVGWCRKTQGWGTNHQGQGRCRLHGGNNRIKHGLYSKIKRPGMNEQIEDWKKLHGEPDLQDLTTEIALAKVMIQQHLSQIPDPDKGSNLVMVTEKTLVDLTSAVGVWMDRVAKLIETHDRIKRGNRLVITNDTVEKLMNEVIALLIKYVPEEKQDEAIQSLRAC